MPSGRSKTASFGVLKLSVLLTFGYFGKWIRNSGNGLKCCAREGWRRSVGPIVWEMRKCYLVREERNIIYTIKRRQANWIGHILHRN